MSGGSALLGEERWKSLLAAAGTAAVALPVGKGPGRQDATLLSLKEIVAGTLTQVYIVATKGVFF